MSIDLSDPKSFLDGVPHAEFDRLRREEPVHWTPVESRGTSSGGFWSLTRAAEVVAVSRDTEAFTNTRGINFPVDYEAAKLQADNVIIADPPRHGDLRRIVGAAFTPRMVSRFSGWITERVDAVLDNLVDAGDSDLVPMAAVELPIQVICSVMGVPDDMRSQVVQWADHMFARQRADVGIEKAALATQSVLQYGLELRAASKHLEATGTMLGELASFERGGVKITDSEFMQMFMALLIAGFETTHTLIGQSFRLMLEQPEVAAQARTAIEEGRGRGLVDEFLRYITPAMHMARHATRDVEVNGTQIRAGDTVLTWFVSANRDSAVFDDPHRFDVTRSPNAHLSFGGGGPHFCIGNQLARLEVQIMLKRLIERGITVSLNGEPKRGWSVFINQLTSLPVSCK